MNRTLTIDLLILILILIFIFVIYLIYQNLKNPFVFPYFIHQFDVSGKRQPDIEDYIDKFLINGGIDEINKHQQKFYDWNRNCKQTIQKSILKKYRYKQYLKVVDNNPFIFYLTREQTRYRQIHYEKYSYTVENLIKKFPCDYSYLINRDKQLQEINYECTLKEYYNKDQRKLMTAKLRQQIKERDNYTCQICGKYMPDEVGLHIDHIIPVAKGGKSVPSNLQVLCSKCNGKKSDKLI